MLRRSMQVIWPAFLMAGVMEILVFAVVDPADLHWFGGAAFDWPLTTTYSVSFLIFWSVIATSAAITAVLISGEYRDGSGPDSTPTTGPEASERGRA